jgi:serine beta-lactamase-like protein LACTB, mitochondrial
MRTYAAIAIIALAAGAFEAVPYAGDAAHTTTPSGACRDWVAARRFTQEIDAVRPLVAKLKRAVAAPGLAVAVAAEGNVVWSSTCGLADRERRVPVARSTRFRIGSVSKPITAVAATRLVQRGRLDLDAEIQTYVDFPRKGWPITVRQLGGHLAGIRHYRGREALSTRRYPSVKASLAIFARDPLVAAPGTRYTYSSYGFNLLGAAVERAAARPFGAAVGELVLQPLRMRATRLDGPRVRGRARFYEVTSRRRAISAPRVDLSNRYPSGGFVSTAEDLARLGTGITDPAFLGPPEQSMLFSSQRTSSGEATGYGLGFEVGESPFGPVAGHTGNVVGGTSFLFIHLRTRVVVALTTNIGFVTASAPPPLGRDVPDPPRLALPFIRRVLGSASETVYAPAPEAPGP